MISSLKIKLFFLFLLSLFFLCPHSRSNPYPPEIARWTQGEKDAQTAAGKQLLIDLDAAIQTGDTTFSVPKGHYRFTKTQGKRPFFIQLLSIKDFTLDGNGSTFWFNDMATALYICKCDNVTVKNLTFDWDPLPFTQGTVMAVDFEINSFTLKIDPGYETVCPRFKAAKGVFRGCLFDAESAKMKPDQVGFVVHPFWDAIQKDGTYQVKIGGFYDAGIRQIGFTPGDRIAFFPRVGRTVKVEGSGPVILENITLFASPFIGFVENAGTGPTTYRKCRILRRPGTTRLMGGNADGFNSANMRHGPILDRCEIDTIGDDFVNIHGVYQRVLDQENDTTLITQAVRTSPDGGSILIYDTATNRFLGRFKARAEKIRYTVKDNRFVAKTKKWAAAKNIEIGSTISATRLVLDRPLKLNGPAYIASEEAVGKNAVIRKCVFTGSLARGIRLQSIGTRIEKNHISWCQGWGLTFAGQPGFWGESTHSRDILVKDNRFEDTCIGLTGTPAAILIASPGSDGTDATQHLRDIRIEDNTIIRPGGNGITVDGGKDITILNNRIQEYGNQTSRREGIRNQGKPLPEVGYAIEVLNSASVILKKNKLKNPGTFAREK